MSRLLPSRKASSGNHAAAASWRLMVDLPSPVQLYSARISLSRAVVSVPRGVTNPSSGPNPLTVIVVMSRPTGHDRLQFDAPCLERRPEDGRPADDVDDADGGRVAAGRAEVVV